MSTLKFYLKVSRPGLWFATIWLYLLPTSQMNDIWSSTAFWYGFFYICFPLNFLVYGWNDIVDRETDALNPRKDSFWFGAKGSHTQLASLWKALLIVQILCFPPLLWFGGWKIIPLFALFLFINLLYNLPQNGLRSRPPFELCCQIGYLLIVPLSIYINEANELPWQTYGYLLLFACQSHLMGEVMDIEPDRKAQRRTTATILGMQKTKLLIIGIVLLEVLMLYTFYDAFLFATMLALGLLWLILDLFLLYKTRGYTAQQMQLFAILSNLVAVVSMAYVWYSGCLLQII